MQWRELDLREYGNSNKKEVIPIRYSTLCERFGREGRTGIKLTCPEGTCRQGYLVYFDRAASEGRSADFEFDQRARLQHPFHPDICAFDEPLPSLSLKEPEAEKKTPILRREMRAELEGPRQPRFVASLPGRPVPTTRKPSAVFSLAKAVAACAAFVVAAIPIVIKSPRPL